MESNSSNPLQIEPKKRILFIITQNEVGGAQRFFSLLFKNLDSSKFDLALAFGNTSSHNSFSEFKNTLSVFELKNLKRNPNFISDIKSIFEIRKVIKNYKPDIIFLNSSKAGFLGSLATVFPSRIRSLEVVYRIGGWTFNDPWPRWKKWLWIRLEKLSAKWKDIIIVNNSHDLKQAEQLKIRPRKEIVIIYNGLDVYKMDFLPKEEAKLKIFEKVSKHSGRIFQVKNIVGTIANFYPTKDLDSLVKVAERFKNDEETAFVIIGEGSERPKLETLIKNLGLDNKIFLIGQVENADRLLSGFDIFVLPSVKEGFPWALIEAMSAKLPVIATNVGAVPEIIDNGKNGFIVEPNNPDQIVEKINTILGDDHLKLELGIQAHQTVLFKFGLDKMIKSIEALL